MASKHAKLKLALTRAIIDFFLQEGLYADELKIQGTLCVTADRSAIFVTQITETVSDGSDGGALLPPHCRVKKVYKSRPYSEPGPYIHDLTAECPEDLTCKSGSRSGGGGSLGRQPPAAHTNNHDMLRFKPLLPPESGTHLESKLEPWPLPLSKSSANDVPEMPNLSRPPCGGIGMFRGGLSTLGLPVLDTSDGGGGGAGGSSRAESLFSRNSAILNAAAKSAIERLTSLSRENEQLQSACAASVSWTQGGGDAAAPLPLDVTSACSSSSTSAKTSSSTDPHAQLQQHQQEVVMDCSSSGAKKRRLLLPVSGVPDAVPLTPMNQSFVDKAHQNAKVSSMPHSNDLDLPQGLLLHVPNPPLLPVMLEEEPLMLVTPKREQVSDNEDGEDENEDRSKVVSNSYSNVSGGSCSPRDSMTQKLHSPPGGVQQPAGGAGLGRLSPWSFSTAGLKEEPSGLPVTDWSSADWMRKPRTKFSQEQLQELETEYKNDPFLSTSADKRAELARRLNITEKNVQIWFQNQRRRRRAAAYSQMHYTGLNDSAQGPGDCTGGGDGAGSKIPNFPESNNIENNTDGTLGSPEFISDQDGENSRNCTPGAGDHIDDDGKHPICEPSQVLYEDSIDDSSSSDLFIATDLSPHASKVIDNHDHLEGQNKGQGVAEVLPKAQVQPNGHSTVHGPIEVSSKGHIQCDSQQQSFCKSSADDHDGQTKSGSGSPQPVSAGGKGSSDGSDLHGAKEVHA